MPQALIATLPFAEIKAKLQFKGADLAEELEDSAMIYEMLCDETAKHGALVKALKLKRDLADDFYKPNRDMLYATLDLEVRKAAQITGDKMTETLVNSKVLSDPRWIAFQNDHQRNISQLNLDYLKAEDDFQSWYDLKKSWDMRHEDLHATARLISSGFIAYNRT